MVLYYNAIMTEFKVQKSPYFSLWQTLDCGQIFRFKKSDLGIEIISKNHRAIVIETESEYIVSATDEEYFRHFFDFDTDYEQIVAGLGSDVFLGDAVEFGKGIRILIQDPVEMIFSFLISQNNHIPRIKAIIERLSEALGENMGDYFAFPTLDALSGADRSLYDSLGLGYRSDYLYTVSRQLKDFDLEYLQTLCTDELRQHLLKLKGVGRKVADCILLFGFRKTDVFPVDTWIMKVYQTEFKGVKADVLSAFLAQKYGFLAGFAQQYLFYWKRTKNV